MPKAKLIPMVLCLTVTMLLFTGCWFSLPWMEEETETAMPYDEDDSLTQDQQPTTDNDQPAAVSNQKMWDTVLYVMDSEMKGLIHFPTQIPWVLGIAKSTVRHLVDSEENRRMLAGTDLKLPLPAGTQIIGATIKEDGLCKMDFSKELLNCINAQHEQLMVDAIVYTLTEFDNIDKVQIMVEGQILDELPFGTKVGSPLRRPDTGMQQGTAATLYFADAAGTRVRFVPVTSFLPRQDLGHALRELMNKPPASLNPLPFPKGTKLLGAAIEQGTAVVNFSRDVLNYGGGTTEYAILGSVVLTVCDWPGVNRVLLQVEGNCIVWPEGTDGRKAFTKNDFTD